MSMLDGTQPGGLTIANHCTMFWNPAGMVKLRVQRAVARLRQRWIRSRKT